MSANNPNRMSAGQWCRQYASVVLIFVVGVAVTLSVFTMAYSWERASVRKEFNSLAVDRFRAVDNTSEQFFKLVSFADNVFMVGPQADSPGFADYVRSLKEFLERDNAEYRAIRALTWIPRVNPDEVKTYDKAGQAVIDPSFRVDESPRPAGAATVADDKAFYPCFLHVGPASDQCKLGENAALDPDARKAMALACDSGEAVATPPVAMSEEGREHYGYRIFQPLYRNDRFENIAQRRENLSGFLCLDLDIGVLVAGAFKNLLPVGVDITVSDVTGEQRVTLCRYLSRLNASAGNADSLGDSELEAVFAAKLFGRSLLLTADAAPVFWKGRTAWQPWMLLVCGLAVTVFASFQRYQRTVHAAAVEQAVMGRMAAFRKEVDEKQARRKEPLAPAEEPAQTPPLGAPVEATTTPGAYDAHTPG